VIANFGRVSPSGRRGLSIFTIEALHGEAQTRLDAGHAFDGFRTPVMPHTVDRKEMYYVLNIVQIHVTIYWERIIHSRHQLKAMASL